MAKGGKRREVPVEARERLTQWIVSQRIDDYLWQKSERHTARQSNAVFNASAVSIWLDFAISPARFAALVRYRHSAKNGRLMESGDARPFKRGDYAAIFAWTGRADGSML